MGWTGLDLRSYLPYCVIYLEWDRTSEARENDRSTRPGRHPLIDLLVIFSVFHTLWWPLVPLLDSSCM